MKRSNKKKMIFITGVAGTGKSTIIKKLQKMKFCAFDIEREKDLCRWRDKKTHKEVSYRSGVGKRWFDSNEWVCDVEKLKKLIANEGGIMIFGGSTANQDEYLPFFDKILLLQCKQKTFINRLKARTGKDEFGKTRTEQKLVLSWYKDFEKDMIGRGAIPVSTEYPVDTIIEQIISLIK
jgi:shikimate kinase